MRVLVVDDEPALAAHLSQALSTAGPEIFDYVHDVQAATLDALISDC